MRKQNTLGELYKKRLSNHFQKYYEYSEKDLHI